MTTTVPDPVIGPARRTFRLPEAWLRATLAGVEAAILGWLLVVVPTVAAYVATAAAPVLGDASWMDATVVGTGVWLLGHGGTIEMTDGSVVSLAPLGVTMVSVALAYGAARRARLRRWGAGGFMIGGYLACVLGISVLIPGPAGRPLVGLASLGIAGLGLLLALWRTGAPAPAWWDRLRALTPSAVRSGLRAGGWAIGTLLLVATALTIIALVQGVVIVLELHEALEPGRLGLVALVAGQLAYLPTIIVWVVSWLIGPGFSVGQGTVFSATEVVAGPLPAIPVLGALPAPGAPGLGWVVLAGIAIGMAVGGWLHRRHFEDVWWRAALSGVVAAVTAAMIAAVLTLAATGSLGPDRMSLMGSAAPSVAGAVAWQVGAGAVVVLLAAHPQVHAAVAAGYRAARRRSSKLRRDDDETQRDSTDRSTPASD